MGLIGAGAPVEETTHITERITQFQQAFTIKWAIAIKTTELLNFNAMDYADWEKIWPIFITR